MVFANGHLLPNGATGAGSSAPGIPASSAAATLPPTQQYCLKWNNHTANMVKTFGDMISQENFTDVTLACDGHIIKAHKIVLSACSNYFREIFLATPCKHPVVILKDMRVEDLKAIIDFMYRGEVNVCQTQLTNLLRTAEVLRVKGLTEVNDEGFKSENDLNGQLANDLGVAHHQVVEQKVVAAVGHPEGLLGQVAAAAAAVGQPFLVAAAQAVSAPAPEVPSVSPGSRKRKRKRATSATRPRASAAPQPLAPPTVSQEEEEAIAHHMALNQGQRIEQTIQQQEMDNSIPSSDDGGEGVNSLVKAAAAAEARESIIAAHHASFGNASTTSVNVTTYSSDHSSPTRKRVVQIGRPELDNAMAGDTVSNDGSESWSQQGNHTMTLAIRSAENDDSEPDPGEMKPIFFDDAGNAMDVSTGSQTAGSQSGEGSGSKICVCHLCHLTFTAYSSLRRHMARHFQDRERYECDVCFKSYSRKDYLKEHKKLKHQSPGTSTSAAMEVVGQK